MKRLLTLCLCIPLLCQAASYSSRRETNTLAGDDEIVFSNTNRPVGSRMAKIKASNLLESLAAMPNWPAGGGGGSLSLKSNGVTVASAATSIESTNPGEHIDLRWSVSGGTARFWGVLNPTATNGMDSRITSLEGQTNALGSRVSALEAGGGGGSTFNGEAAVTNANRVGLVSGKSGVTNLLRSLQPLSALIFTNQGTNIILAIQLHASQLSQEYGALTIASGVPLTNVMVRGQWSIPAGSSFFATQGDQPIEWGYGGALTSNTVVLFQHLNAQGLALSNLVSDLSDFVDTNYQPLDPELTGWAALATNILSSKLSGLTSAGNTNSTQLSLVKGGTNTTGLIKTLTVTGSATATEQGDTNIVINVTGGGGSLKTNANQFAAGDTLAIKDGATVTNLVNYLIPSSFVFSNAGLSFWFRANDYIGSYADGANVTNFLARKGGMVTNSAATVKMKYATMPSGLASFQFNGSFLQTSNAILDSTMDRAFTVFAVLIITNNPSSWAMWGSDNGNNKWSGGHNAPNSHHFYTTGLTDDTIATGTPLNSTTNGYHYEVAFFAWDGTNKYSGDGRHWQTELATGTLGLNSVLTIGAWSPGGLFPFKGHIAEMLIFNKFLGDATNYLVATELYQTYGMATNFPDLFVGIGDSMTSGSGLNSYDTYLQVIYRQSQNSIAFLNLGTAGITISNLNYSMSVADTLFRKPPGQATYPVIWGGRNDLAAASSAATESTFTITNILTLSSNLMAQGCEPYIITIPGTASANDYYTGRATVNAALRASYRTYASRLIDLDRIPNFGSTPTNSPGWQSDKIHPNAGGERLVGAEVWRQRNRNN